MTKIEWAADPAAESRVTRLGSKLVVSKGIKISEIDIHGSRANNARLDTPFNSDLALEYALSMESGDKFPYPVLRRVDNKRYSYVVLSGNHRIGAAETLLPKDGTIDAYILDSKDEQVAELVCRSANRWMGDRQSKEEAIEHARVLIERYNYTATHMSKVFGLHEKTLLNALRAEGVRDVLEANLVDASGMNRAVLTTLAPIDNNHEILRRAAQACIRYGLTAERTRPMVQEVKQARDERESLNVIGRWEAKFQEEKPRAAPGVVKTMKGDPRAKLMRYFGNVVEFLNRGGPGKKPFQSLSQLRISSPDDRKALLAIYREVKTAMKRCVDGENAIRESLNGNAAIHRAKAKGKKVTARRG